MRKKTIWGNDFGKMALNYDSHSRGKSILSREIRISMMGDKNREGSISIQNKNLQIRIKKKQFKSSNFQKQKI